MQISANLSFTFDIFIIRTQSAHPTHLLFIIQRLIVDQKRINDSSHLWKFMNLVSFCV